MYNIIILYLNIHQFFIFTGFVTYFLYGIRHSVQGQKDKLIEQSMTEKKWKKIHAISNDVL